ncbi:hypothetical protein AAE478_000600 [Parahypoxylon ruwenzoriense]
MRVASHNNKSASRVNSICDRIQLTVFFVQKLFLSALYIHQTRKYLRDSSVLLKPSLTPTSFSTSSSTEENRVLHHLIYANLLIIALDVALVGIEYADLSYSQGAFKPCVYGIKLKIEFVILNSLIKSLRGHSSDGGRGYAQSWSRRHQWRRVGSAGQTETSKNYTGEQIGAVHLDRLRKGSDYQWGSLDFEERRLHG